MQDNIIKLMPSIKVTPIDSTGAGDIFHGAFTYCIAKGYDIEKTLKISNITAGLSVTKIGGRNSVFPLEEVMKIYEENI
jgi:sugar/nucleoside kinase (ribokinase family)